MRRYRIKGWLDYRGRPEDRDFSRKSDPNQAWPADHLPGMFAAHALEERAIVKWCRLTSFLTDNKRFLKRLHLGLVLFQQTETRPRHFAGGPVAARLNLHIYEVDEMIAN